MAKKKLRLVAPDKNYGQSRFAGAVTAKWVAIATI